MFFGVIHVFFTVFEGYFEWEATWEKVTCTICTDFNQSSI
jgi:hypothetical protein